MRIQALESRRLMAATPIGATWKDTGEYLLGKVAVTTVLLESNGAIDPSTEDWTQAEIDASIAKVEQGVGWWSDTLDNLNTVHELEFVFDHTFAETPFETSYEPISRRSQDQQRYVGEFLLGQGITGERSIEDAMWRSNHAQREAHDANWAFTVFIVDASSDSDGLFAPGGFPAAFALPGGLHMVVPSGRSASTIAHETGHIFWAFDEYPGGASYHARRGYYDSQNLNASEDHPDSDLREDSIMDGGVSLFNAFLDNTSPESTLALIGWRDSDGDGVFDVLDVPLDLDAVGYFDEANSEYHFTGSAAAVALHNRNSYGEHPSVIGTNADITLNRISEIQYRLDDGPWIAASQPDLQEVEFDLSVSIDSPFDSIQWRAIDLTTGVTSETLDGTAVAPALPATSQNGYGYLDQDENGERDGTDPLLAQTQVTIRNSDGSALFGGFVDAADFTGALPALDGVTLTVDGPDGVTEPDLDPTLLALPSSSAGRDVFQAQEFRFDGSLGPTRDRWGKREFVATFDENVGFVELDVNGLDLSSYGRLEAFDAQGNLVARTTKEIVNRESAILVVEDPNGSIASIRAYGVVHTSSGISISSIRFGFHDTVETDVSGSWQFPNLPDGDYLAELTPRLVIHAFDQPVVNVQVSNGSSEQIVAAALRVDSPRHNSENRYDTNGDGNVTAGDALVVINDLTRNDARIIAHGETGFDVDVNNDGSVSALDALQIINFLGRISGAEGESLGSSRGFAGTSTEGGTPGVDAAFGQWSASTTDTTDQVIQASSEFPGFRSDGSMLDSAGHTTRVESSDTNNADRGFRSSVGTDGQRNGRYSTYFAGQEPLIDASRGTNKTENVDKDSPFFGSLKSEFSEPL